MAAYALLASLRCGDRPASSPTERFGAGVGIRTAQREQALDAETAGPQFHGEPLGSLLGLRATFHRLRDRTTDNTYATGPAVRWSTPTGSPSEPICAAGPTHCALSKGALTTCFGALWCPTERKAGRDKSLHLARVVFAASDECTHRRLWCSHDPLVQFQYGGF